MISRPVKALIFGAAILAFTLALVGGAALFASTGQPWPAAGWALVWGIAIKLMLVFGAGHDPSR